jgi:hypothetical protein
MIQETIIMSSENVQVHSSWEHYFVEIDYLLYNLVTVRVTEHRSSYNILKTPKTFAI